MKERFDVEKIISDRYNHARSAWDKGVLAYADDLLEAYFWEQNSFGRDARNYKEAEHWMLNGANNWSHYSWAGCSLCYDGDIAERLCTPSEFKKRNGGAYKPNRDEEWLDVQARALYQAARVVWNCLSK